MQKTDQKSLGLLLVELGLLSREQLDKLYYKQQLSSEHLSTLCLQMDMFSEKMFVNSLCKYFNLPSTSLKDYDITSETIRFLPYDLLSRHQFLPVAVEAEKIYMATANPLDVPAIDEIKLLTGKEVELIVVSPLEIDSELNRCYELQNCVNKAMNSLVKETGENQVYVKEEYDRSLDETPIVKIVNTIIIEAVNKRASDIHFEPREEMIAIRIRVDGKLMSLSSLPKISQEPLISRIKVISDMDITNKRIPQDGRCKFEYKNSLVDLRISVLPTIYGEKVVIRILPREKVILNMDELGFDDECLNRYRQLLDSANGMILVTGPTGCGKTTTLYSTLNWLNNIDKNIVTVEDPVEYRLQNINQVEINEKSGLSFANGLRSILRQDPDVIMVGEIRDLETAQIAIRSALTGHLVFSTLHTSDCIGAISRLTDMGIPWYLVSSAIDAVLSQRLVRILCKHCKIAYTTTSHELEFINKIVGRNYPRGYCLYKPKGCKHCDWTGYFGRKAVFELLIINKQIIDALVKDRTKEDLVNFSGYYSLYEHAIELVLIGETCLEEVTKIAVTTENRK